MLKVSRMGDYGFLVLEILTRQDEYKASVSSIVAKSHLPSPTVAKVLQKLASGGLVSSMRGVSGGYRLAKSPDEITVMHVIEALEGPIAVMACVDESTDDCSAAQICPLQGHWNIINSEIRRTLKGITLSQLLFQPKMAAFAGLASQPLNINNNSPEKQQ